MSEQNGSTAPAHTDGASATSFDKGKGKAAEAAAPHDVSMGEEETEDDTSEDEVDEVKSLAQAPI